jgi:hypothetical protein
VCVCVCVCVCEIDLEISDMVCVIYPLLPYTQRYLLLQPAGPRLGSGGGTGRQTVRDLQGPDPQHDLLLHVAGAQQ